MPDAAQTCVWDYLLAHSVNGAIWLHETSLEEVFRSRSHDPYCEKIQTVILETAHWRVQLIPSKCSIRQKLQGSFVSIAYLHLTAGERRQHVSDFLQLGLALVSFPVLFKSWLIRGAQTPSYSPIECEITVTSYCFNDCHVWTWKNLDINVDTSTYYSVPQLRYVRTGLINCKRPALLKALFVNLVF